MDARELKEYIYENRLIEQILESIECHHIKYHSTGGYYTACNPDGDNQSAIVLYDNEMLICINHTRKMVNHNRTTDILDLVGYVKELSFPEAMKFVCQEIGLSYYHDFSENVPKSIQILKLIEQMNINSFINEEKSLIKLNETVISYYFNFVNKLFYDDGINYSTQREFEIGFDPESNRYTIPIRSEIGDLVGVKGRYFYRDVPEGENKYIYLEPCPKSRILYGLYKSLPHIKREKKVYVFESEKAVMQCWSMGIYNTVSVGGKQISNYQIEMLTRLGVDIIFCFDKDVEKEEIFNIAKKFLDGIPLFYMFDEDNILDKKESPSDNEEKLRQLIKNNIYMII